MISAQRNIDPTPKRSAIILNRLHNIIEELSHKFDSVVSFCGIDRSQIVLDSKAMHALVTGHAVPLLAWHKKYYRYHIWDRVYWFEKFFEMIDRELKEHAADERVENLHDICTNTSISQLEGEQLVKNHLEAVELSLTTFLEGKKMIENAIKESLSDIAFDKLMTFLDGDGNGPEPAQSTLDFYFSYLCELEREQKGENECDEDLAEFFPKERCIAESQMAIDFCLIFCPDYALLKSNMWNSEYKRALAL